MTLCTSRNANLMYDKIKDCRGLCHKSDHKTEFKVPEIPG